MKSPRPPHMPATPVSEAAVTVLDSQDSLVPADEDLGQRPSLQQQLRKLLRIHVQRKNGDETPRKPVLLGCAMVTSKGCWRWQIRSHPPLAGTDSPSPHEALHAFLRTHEHRLHEDSLAPVRGHLHVLQRRSADFLEWMQRAMAHPAPVVVQPPALPATQIVEEEPLSWQDLETLLGANIPTMRHLHGLALERWLRLYVTCCLPLTGTQTRPVMHPCWLHCPSCCCLS